MLCRCVNYRYLPRLSRVLFVLAALICSAGAALAVESKELLANGGFEHEKVGAGTPDGWLLMSGQSASSMQRDTDVKRSGAASLRVDLTPAASMCWPGYNVEGIKPDTNYKLSGWARASETLASPFIVNVEPNLGGTELKLGTEWTRWECTLNSADATKMMVGLRLRGQQGSIWIDDISLVQVGNSGESILSERRELLKLVEYQQAEVPASSNTDEWTKPLRGTVDPATAFAGQAVPGIPQWKVGQWARYLCHDQLIVPSVTPEKRPLVSVIDCSIVGAEKLNGKDYYWYQSVVQLDKYWVAGSTGRSETGKKILLGTKRKVVILLLVDGPEFRDIQRYQLKVDDEPLLEYTDGQRPVLPVLNFDYALIRPQVASILQGQMVSPDTRIPVTGALRLEQHLPHLDRNAQLVNWGEEGAEDARRGEEPIVVGLQRAPYLTVAFDGFGDLKHYREMLSAGVGAFHSVNLPYFGEVREFVNTMPAYFSNTKRWDVDLFDVCRSNFRGFAPHLDEPYQRQTKRAFYFNADQAGDIVAAADLYSNALEDQVAEACFWPGQTIPDYNSPPSAAWYSARAGASGFILENARLTDQMMQVAKATGHSSQREFVVELNIACMRGAARRFNTWWGMGIYRWISEELWKDELLDYARRGSSYHGFWIEGGAALRDPELKFYDKVVKVIPDIAKALKQVKPQPQQATALILVPNGYLPGFLGSNPVKPWGVIDFPRGEEMTYDVIRKAHELFARGIVFDIAVDDPQHPLHLESYERVIRVE